MYKVLISGFGSIGKRHALNLKALGHNVSVYDPIQSSDSSFENSMRWVSHVIISSPAKFHAEQAIAAIKAGKHVFIEKPMATTVEEGEAIVSAAMQSDKSIAVGYQWRCHENLIQIKKFIENIARLKSLHFELIYRGNKDNWPGNCYEDLLLECSHEIDTLRWIRNYDLSLCKVDLRDNDAVIKYVGGFATATICLDWKRKQPPYRGIGICQRNIDLSWSFDETNHIDLRFLNHAYKSELINWLEEKSICRVQDGLQVLKDIDEIRKFAKHKAF